MFRKRELHIETERDHVATMAAMARKAVGCPKFANHVEHTSLADAYALAQEQYQREEGEIFLDPRLFLKFGAGDCDDQVIYWTAYLLQLGIPADLIDIAVLTFDDQPEENHVVTRLRGRRESLWLDGMPGLSIGEVSPYDTAEFYEVADL